MSSKGCKKWRERERKMLDNKEKLFTFCVTMDHKKCVRLNI